MTVLIFLLGLTVPTHAEIPVPTPSIAETGKNPEVALVYKGPGGCASCANAAGKVARDLGFEVEYVAPSKLKKSTFKNKSVWIQPAGNAFTAAKALGEDGLALIREFVQKGGHYMGFCAGAFLADKTLDEEGKIMGLGLIPMSADYYEVNEDDNIGLAKMAWGQSQRYVFFNGGAQFLFDPKQRPEVSILARYLPGQEIATIHVKYGQGNVVLTGAHPEAPKAWKTKHKLVDKDGDDFDLARQMLQEALER